MYDCAPENDFTTNAVSLKWKNELSRISNEAWKFSESKLTRDCLVWVYHTYHQTHCTNHLCVGRSTHAGILRGKKHITIKYQPCSIPYYPIPHQQYTISYHIPNFINRKDFSLILGVSWPTFSRYFRMNMLGAKLTIFCSPQPYGIFNKFSIPPIDEPRISPWKTNIEACFEIVV